MPTPEAVGVRLSDYRRRRLLRARREWLRSIVVDPALDVSASYQATFTPLYGRVAARTARGRPSRAKRSNRWIPLASPTVTAQADPSDGWDSEWTIASDAAGWFVRDYQGDVVRDPSRIRKLLEPERPTLGSLVDAAVAQAAGAWYGERRRRPERHTMVRALLYRDLAPVVGHRASARLIIRWERELEAPWPPVTGRARVETMLTICRRALAAGSS